MKTNSASTLEGTTARPPIVEGAVVGYTPGMKPAVAAVRFSETLTFLLAVPRHLPEALAIMLPHLLQSIAMVQDMHLLTVLVLLMAARFHMEAQRLARPMDLAQPTALGRLTRLALPMGLLPGAWAAAWAVVWVELALCWQQEELVCWVDWCGLAKNSEKSATELRSMLGWAKSSTSGTSPYCCPTLFHWTQLRNVWNYTSLGQIHT